MANNSNLSKRVALRQQQELEARRKRNARMLGVGLGVLALVVVVVIAVVIANAIGSKAPAAEQLTPPNATEGHGIAIKSKNTQPAGDVPNVVVYEDYQCPACKVYEARYGNAFQQLIDEGKITLEIRTAYFLNDANKTMNKKSSERAALAATAAERGGAAGARPARRGFGKYREYHKVVYDNQPEHEGDGYTDQQLRVDFAAKAGITGDDLATFQKLYDTKAYADFAKKSFETMGEAGIGGTPAYVVNGKKINLESLSSNDPQTVLTAIQSAASGS